MRARRRRRALTYEYEKFPFKCFTDCVVCVTGFQLEERKEIQEMVEKNGGEFRADLEKDVVTHLVAKQTNGQAEPTGPKYTREDVENFRFEQEVGG